MKKRYSMFSAWFLCFFSPALYRDVGQRWGGICFFYLLITLAVCWIPLAYQLNKTYDAKVETLLPVVSNDMPEITIQNGEIAISKRTPYVFKDKEGKPLIIIDTTGQTKSLDNTPAYLLITQNKIFLRKDIGEIGVYEIPDTVNFSIGEESVRYWMEQSTFWFLMLFYPLMIVLSLFYRFIQALFYSFVGGVIFANLVRCKITYQSMFRLSIMAVTPVIIISTVVRFVGYQFPFSGLDELLLYFSLSMLYLLFGVFANRKSAVKADF